MSPQIMLRPFRPEDLAKLRDWLNKPYIQKTFGEAEEWLSEIAENLESADWVHYFIIWLDRPIGFCQYYDTQKAPPGEWSAESPRTAGIDYLIGEETYLGKGFGKQSLELLLTKISRDPAFDFVIADPDPENEISVHILKKLGFSWNENSVMHRRV